MPILEVADTVGRLSMAGKTFKPGQYDLSDPTIIEQHLVPEVVRAVGRLVFPHATIYEIGADGRAEFAHAEDYAVPNVAGIVDQMKEAGDGPELPDLPTEPGDLPSDEKIGMASTGEDLELPEPAVEAELAKAAEVAEAKPDPFALSVEDLKAQPRDFTCNEPACDRTREGNGFKTLKALKAHKSALHKE